MEFVSVIRRGSRNSRVLFADGHTALFQNDRIDEVNHVILGSAPAVYTHWVPVAERGDDYVPTHRTRRPREVNPYAEEANAETVEATNVKGIDEVSFGIEIEFCIPYDNVETMHERMREIVGAENYVSCDRYTHNDGSKWIMGRDGSLRPKSGEKGCELSSPIFKFDHESITTLKNIVVMLKSLGGVGRRSCGIHIHMSHAALNYEYEPTPQFTSDFQRIVLAQTFSEYEKYFDAIVKKYRRDTHYAGSERVKWNRLVTTLDRFHYYDDENTVSVREAREQASYFGITGDRYNALNLQESSNVEIRKFQSELDFDLIKTWLELSAAWFIYALDKADKIYLNSSRFTRSEIEITNGFVVNPATREETLDKFSELGISKKSMLKVSTMRMSA